MKPILLFLLLLIPFISINAQSKTKSTIDKLGTSTSEAVETVYNDGKSVVNTLYEDSKDVVEYITPKIEEAVTSIANALSIGANEVFSILTRQQLVVSIVNIIVLLFGLLCIYFDIFFTKKIVNSTKIKKNDFEILVIIIIILTVSAFFALLHFFFNLDSTIMGLINPEYGAIKEIMDTATQLLNK